MGSLLHRLVSQSRGRLVLALALLAFTAGLLVAQTTVPAPDDTFATLDGTNVTWGEFYQRLQDYAGREISERLLIEHALRAEATKLGVEPTPQQIDERLRELVQTRFAGSVADFAEWMTRDAKTEDSLRRTVTNELRDLAVRSHGVNPTEDQLKAYFAKHQADRYDRPPMVKFRRVVLESEAKAKEVLAKIKAGETDFFGAAMNYSIDVGGQENGGLVGPVPVPFLTAQAKPVADALAKLQVYQYTEAPVEAQAQWHLLLLVERQEGKPRTYEEVQTHVFRDYLQEHAVPENEYYPKLMRQAQLSGLPARYRVLEALFSKPGNVTPPEAGE